MLHFRHFQEDVFEAFQLNYPVAGFALKSKQVEENGDFVLDDLAQFEVQTECHVDEINERTAAGK
jgi:hypothetical protein